MNPIDQEGAIPQSQSSSDAYLRANEAAQYMKISGGTLAEWRVKGFGPRYSKIGRVVVYRRVDLDAYVEAGLVRSTSESTVQNQKKR